MDTLVVNEFPGSVLVKLGFGTAADYKANRSNWTDRVQGLLKRETYELRVHIYQVSPGVGSRGGCAPSLPGLA